MGTAQVVRTAVTKKGQHLHRPFQRISCVLGGKIKSMESQSGTWLTWPNEYPIPVW